jgi:hypothetical protein
MMTVSSEKKSFVNTPLYVTRITETGYIHNNTLFSSFRVSTTYA